MFEPWVGPRYGDGENRWNGRKLLVVGESHYDSKETIGKTIPNFTKGVLRRHIEWKQRLRFFSNIATLLNGVPAGQNRQLASSVWNEVAFYNYLPVIAAEGPRKPIPQSFWGMGITEFNHVLGELKPDHVLVFGWRLWRNSFYRHSDGKVPREDNATTAFSTCFGSMTLPSLKFPHASSPAYSGKGLAFSRELDQLVAERY